MSRFYYPWCCNLLILGFIWGVKWIGRENWGAVLFVEQEKTGCFAVPFLYGRNASLSTLPTHLTRFHLWRELHIYLMTPIKLSHILSKWYLSNTCNHFPKISFPIPHTSENKKEKKPSFNKSIPLTSLITWAKSTKGSSPRSPYVTSPHFLSKCPYPLLLSFVPSVPLPALQQ